MQSRQRKFSLAFLVAASVLVPAGLFMVYAAQGYHAILADANDRMARRAAVLAEHTARLFDTYALVIDMVDRRLRQDRHDLGETLAILTEYAGRTGAISAIVLLDSEGRNIGSSRGEVGKGLDNSQREYFTRALAEDGLVVGPQVKGKISGDPIFSLSRRVGGGGVVAVTIRTSYFEDVFSSMAEQEGPPGIVTLYRDDGRPLVRYPRAGHGIDLDRAAPGLMRHLDKPAGFYRVVPENSRKERLFAFNQVPGYPVYVTYGLDVHQALAPWLANLAVSGLLAALAAGLLTAFSLFAAQRLAQANRTEAMLQRKVADRTAESLRAINDREFALRQWEAAHHAKAHFLAAASHDLRQPIQALRLFLEVLGGRLREPSDQLVLDHASKALRGAEDLLAALLDVSTLDAGMVAADCAQVALRDILDDLTNEFSGQAEAKGIRFRYVPTSAWVRTDAVLLSRVLRNLLVNALRYTSRGSILLGCRLKDGAVRIEVWDTGKGIPADKLERVFEDFVQLGNPERDRTKGLGLGLAVVRRMATLLGHPVDVRSWEGRGTVFSVSLDRVYPPLGAVRPVSVPA